MAGTTPLTAATAACLGALAAAQLSVLGQLRVTGIAVSGGAVCTVPNLVLLLVPDAFEDWMRDPYYLIDAAARPLLLVGLLGAATTVWWTGAHQAGATNVLTPVLVAVAVVAAGLFPLCAYQRRQRGDHV